MTEKRNDLQAVLDAIDSVVGYLWEDEQRDYEGQPGEDHIYHQLVVLKLWRESAVHPLTQSDGADFFGGCPACGHNDGYLNIRRCQWFVCHKHRTKWLIGENLFSSWRRETEHDWQQNFELIQGYREVHPVYPNPTEPTSTD